MGNGSCRILKGKQINMLYFSMFVDDDEFPETKGIIFFMLMIHFIFDYQNVNALLMYFSLMGNGSCRILKGKQINYGISLICLGILRFSTMKIFRFPRISILFSASIDNK